MKEIYKDNPVIAVNSCIDQTCCYSLEQDNCNDKCMWNDNKKVCTENDSKDVPDCSVAQTLDDCLKIILNDQSVCTWSSFLNKCFDVFDTSVPASCYDLFEENLCNQFEKCSWCSSSGLCLPGNAGCECSGLKGIDCQESNLCDVVAAKDYSSWECRSKRDLGKKRENDVNCQALNANVNNLDYYDCECSIHTDPDECLSYPGCKLCSSDLSCIGINDRCKQCSEIDSADECTLRTNCRLCNDKCQTIQAPCKTCRVFSENVCSSKSFNDVPCSFCESTNRCDISTNESSCKTCNSLSVESCELFANGCSLCNDNCQNNSLSCSSLASSNSAVVIVVVVVVVSVIIILVILVFIFFKKKSAIKQDESSMITLSEFSSSELNKNKDFTLSGSSSSALLFSVEADLGITCQPECVEFVEQKNSGLLDVNSEYTTSMILKNNTSHSCEIAFDIENYDRNLLIITPDHLKLHRAKSYEVTFKLTMHGSGKYL